MVLGDDNTEWEPDAISEEPVVKYEEGNGLFNLINWTFTSKNTFILTGQLKSVIEPNVLEKGLEDAKVLIYFHKLNPL